MRVYVTGGTGFVGSNVVKLYGDWHRLDVVAGGTRPPERPLPATFSRIELLDRDALRTAIVAAEPDVVVHAAILNDLSAIYADRRLAWDSYVESTRTVADAANEVGAILVYVSTDWVFDGTQAGADERTPTNPINLYGHLKAAAELVTLERAREPIVVRVAGVNGVHWARAEGPRAQDAGLGHYVAALVDALSVGEPFIVWEGEDVNERGTPSLASESAEMMLGLVRAGARGVFHCCGGESVTRMELARAAVDVFGLEADLLRSGPPPLEGMLPAPVPRDTSLDARATAEAIGYALPSVRELLGAFRSQRETGELRPLAAPANHPLIKVATRRAAR
ncbi:MAG TPA: sugar nucleotide-binding protein [Conexibacter sp.]|nr:sugar nucleotide-binding protein [Conexibacter sp.]